MNRFLAFLPSALAMVAFAQPTAVGSATHTIARAGSLQSAPGPAASFTGSVRVEVVGHTLGGHRVVGQPGPVAWPRTV